MLITDVVVHRYRGTYKGHDVAIKCLGSANLSNPSQVEFLQEVLILRQAFTVHNNWINQFHFVPTNSRYFLSRGVNHENILQFYGACTKHPNYCIITGMITCYFLFYFFCYLAGIGLLTLNHCCKLMVILFLCTHEPWINGDITPQPAYTLWSLSLLGNITKNKSLSPLAINSPWSI